MPKIQLPEELQVKLAKTPETGMGYHTVRVELNDGSILNRRTVVNEEWLVLNDGERHKTDDIKSVTPLRGGILKL